jgi:hypothetical protein
MCDLGYHHCPTCHEPLPCDLPNRDCDGMGMYETQPCGKCEFYIEEQLKEAEREERLAYERQQWEMEFGHYGK